MRLYLPEIEEATFTGSLQHDSLNKNRTSIRHATIHEGKSARLQPSSNKCGQLRDVGRGTNSPLQVKAH